MLLPTRNWKTQNRGSLKGCANSALRSGCAVKAKTSPMSSIEFSRLRSFFLYEKRKAFSPHIFDTYFLVDRWSDIPFFHKFFTENHATICRSLGKASKRRKKSQKRKREVKVIIIKNLFSSSSCAHVSPFLTL